MAADTVSRDVDVVKIRRQPAYGRMAIVAVAATRNVSCMFSACGRTVMARTAGTQNLRMVDRNNGFKYERIVAILADIGR